MMKLKKILALGLLCSLSASMFAGNQKVQEVSAQSKTDEGKMQGQEIGKLTAMLVTVGALASAATSERPWLKTTGLGAGLAISSIDAGMAWIRCGKAREIWIKSAMKNPVYALLAGVCVNKMMIGDNGWLRSTPISAVNTLARVTHESGITPNIAAAVLLAGRAVCMMADTYVLQDGTDFIYSGGKCIWENGKAVANSLKEKAKKQAKIWTGYTE